ncbi:MAG TPA: formylglycine-generating enzyme family protein [Verrucomicrobiae bacterium]|nr:formylglycine-generating enzyme family protein [Verrucomicrobiae bacterium]
MNAVPLATGSKAEPSSLRSRAWIASAWRRYQLALLGVAVVLATPAAHAFVYETDLELFSTGDFNGDGNTDIVIVEKARGRARIGYRVSSEFFNWANWRATGVRDVTGMAVGKLTDGKHDSFGFVSKDANMISTMDAENPNIPEDPTKINTAVLGPSTVVAIDIGGAGNTPLQDLYVGSIYNNEPENRITLFRTGSATPAQLSEQPAVGPEAQGNRVSLKTGGPEFVATLVSGETSTLRIEKLDSGKPEEVLSIGGVPPDASYLIGNFRGQPTKEFVFYVSGESNLHVSVIEETGGKYQASPLKSITLERAPRQLVVLDGEKKSQLVGVFGDQEPAELMSFDGANPPTSTLKLAGATNRFLNAAIALPDAIVLFSTFTNNPVRPVSHYQVHSLKDGTFVPTTFGSLASLDDRDDSTVPEIYKRIVANQVEKTQADMKSYTNMLPGTEVTYEMVAIPGGEFTMGSPDAEKGRKPDEGPQHKVKISPFWMGKYEITWDMYLLFMYPDDELKARETHATPEEVNSLSDAVTRPSKPYVDMSFGMGKSGYPAIAMTQHGANKFCHWLSAKTGHFYRLPTEAEWEYACRAGTTTAYSFGDDEDKLPEYAWFFDNSNSKYQKVGKKKPNPWGLYDMHGNVTEWVLDQYDPEYYQTLAALGLATDPWNRATQPYPHSARGGSWDDDPQALRSAARRGSDRSWKMTDPQLPKGIWYHTDATFIGFRIVRPLAVPSAEEMTKYWISGVEKD